MNRDTNCFLSASPVTSFRHPSLNPPSSCTNNRRRRHGMSFPTMIFPFSNLWSQQDQADKPAFNFRVGYSYLSHPEKNTGEDAFFVEGNSAGVFDGVSGAFETRGVDPRLYSQTLALLTRDKVRKYGPKSVVKAAIDASLENDQIGASTACVVGMDATGRLYGISLGDSGVRVVRNGKVMFRTKEQQHFFNCPYQLGTDSQDGLAMGENVLQKLKIGDVVVLATDGLYDNVGDRDICDVVSSEGEEMELAEKLGEMASARGIDSSFRSPFMEAALKANVEWKGGKADDVTVVLLRVVREEVQKEALLSTLPEAEAAA